MGRCGSNCEQREVPTIGADDGDSRVAITTLEGMVDAIEALGRRSAHLRHHHTDEAPHQPPS